MSDDPKIAKAPLSSLRPQRSSSARPRASTGGVAPPALRLSSLASDVVTNSPVTPRNQLAAVIHRERLESVPRSPRTASPVDPQDTVTASTSTKVVDKQHELFKPPSELPEEVRGAYKAAMITERSRRRQERAAKEILHVQKQGVSETSAAITKVISYNVDKIDSDSDSDDYKQSEVRFYPFEVALEDKAVSPRKPLALALTQKSKQRHSLDIEAIEDIRSNSDDDAASDDSDTIDDCEQTLSPISFVESKPKPVDYAQAMGERVKAKNDFVIMQTVLTSKTCDYDFLKVYDTIWCGLKPVVREQFWMSQLAAQSGGATEDIELPSFETLIANGQITRLCYDEILKDLYRTFPFVMRHRPDLDRQTYRALVAYAIYRPDIGYVQSMSHIYMTILSVLPHQVQQFRMMEHITRRIMPYHYDTDMVGVRVDGAVLAAYMRIRCRKLTEFYETQFETAIDNLTFELAAVWFLKLFVQVLQGSQLLRLWDMIMLRGSVTLIQFTLQILSYAYKRELFIKQSNYSEFIATMTKHLRGLESIDSILKTRLADKHIPIEDFDLRRRAATRIQLENLAQRTMPVAK